MGITSVLSVRAMSLKSELSEKRASFRKCLLLHFFTENIAINHNC